MPNGLSGYVAYPKADLVALLRTLAPEAVVGVRFDIERYRLTGERREPIPITSAVLLELLDTWPSDVVPIDEHEFSYFAIRLDSRPMDTSKWVTVKDASPLFAEFQSRRRGFGE